MIVNGIHNCSGLIDYINKIGFLPLLRMGIEGWSAEEAVDEECRYDSKPPYRSFILENYSEASARHYFDTAPIDNWEGIWLMTETGERVSIERFKDVRFSEIFTHRIVRDITNVIRLAQDPRDGALFLELYYKLGAGVSKAAAEEAVRRCTPEGPTLLELLAGSSTLSPWSKRQCRGLQTHLDHLLEERADKAVWLEKERSLRQQIANVSHDLRTPLTSILGYLQLLEGGGLTEEERREYLAVVESRAKALQSLITGFYDLSRLEGGEYPLTREPVNLYSSLSGLLAAFYNDFTDRGFDMTVELEENLPPVQADSGGVLRVFTNLIRNALDHGQGKMTVRLFQTEEGVVSLFANETHELTEEDLPRVFDRFFT